MRNAEIILSTIADRGRRGLPLEGVYRLLYNRELYLMAYGRISSNKGATTPGVTSETADAMSLAKIDGIIEQIRKETYRWTPVRRSYIPKANGKKRPLGIPTWSDRMLQEVIRLILDAYYDPQFTDRSCGFRTGMGCHTALRQVSRWKGTTWFIEGDITGCFDNIDHDVLMQIIREKIHDGRFCRLLDELLRAGYLEDWKYNPTLSGTPQGGIVSPLLSNIYLDRLDQYVEQTLIPQYTRGLKRRRNPTYLSREQSSKYWQEHGQIERAMAIRKDMQRYPSIDVNDPGFRRLNYVRYADDFLLGFIGPKEEAEAIKRQVGEFLRDTLKLELSESKTLVTHGRTEAAKFLGYEVSTAHVDDKHTKPENHRWTARWTNGVILLRVPKSFVTTKMAPFQRDGRAMHRPERMQDEAFSIVSQYAAEYRGFVQYYKLAINLRILNQLRYAMESSLVKTLAGKFRTLEIGRAHWGRHGFDVVGSLGRLRAEVPEAS